MAVENRRGRVIPSMRPRDETRGAANAGTRPGNTLYRIDWWQEGRSELSRVVEGRMSH